jgi:serine/threonine-protein kinase RsbW
MSLEKPVSCSTVVASTSSAISYLRENFLSNLRDYNYGESDIFAVHLALEEAFINAVKHGNKMDSFRGVKIDYLVEADKVTVSVTDEGDGFDPESVPDPRYGENLYKPEGRGLFLMCSYMDVVEFNERGNSVCMVKYKENMNPPKGVPNGATRNEV